MPPNKPHILVLDSEYLIAMDAERILTATLDCTVNIAATPADAIELAQNHSFDLVLLDVGSNLETLRDHVRELETTIGLIAFTTAYDDFADGVPGMEQRAVITKPFDETRLATTVRDLLGIV